MLGAGDSTRMGRSKLGLEIQGEPAFCRILRRAADAGARRGLVAHRGADGEEARRALEGCASVALEARLVAVPEDLRARGPIGSLSALIGEAEPGLPRLVWPVDHPHVSRETLGRLLEEGDGPRVPVFEGRGGHPVLLPPKLDGAVREAAAAGASLREVLRASPLEVQRVPVRDPGVLWNCDRPADLGVLPGAPDPGGAGLLALQRAHRSRRSFAPDPVPPSLLEDLVDAARHASTSSFVQAVSVVAVEDDERLRRVHDLCGKQRMILEAPVFLGICADLRHAEAALERAGDGLREPDLELFLVAALDAALFGQNLLLAAEASGLGGCFVGGARLHPRELAALLGLPPRVWVPFGLVLGRPLDDPLPRGRLPLPAVLHRETYSDAAVGAALPRMDEAVRSWARLANREGRLLLSRPLDESKGWGPRLRRSFGASRPPSRAHLPEALAALGFPFLAPASPPSRDPDGSPDGSPEDLPD